MKSLTIELTKGSRKQFQSIGWKTPNEGDCRRKIFALDESGKPLIVTLKPVVPEWYLPGFKAVFSCEPFPEAVCIEILRCRLLPPPCCQSCEEFESHYSHNDVFELGQGNASGAPEQVLILEPSDDGPLQARLDKWLAVMGAAYECERDSLLRHIAGLKSASLAELNLTTEDERSNRLKNAEEQLAIINSETPIDGVPCKGRLKLTLDQVKQGREGIRDAFLQEDWAERTGEDLAAMASERRAHRDWLRAHTGTPSNTFYANTRQKLLDVAPPVFGADYERDPQFRAACTKVRYRAKFADNANSVVYLEDIETREELTAAEHDEVATLSVWTPEDRLKLELVKADGTVEDIETGSAGQRTAGLLGLVLSLDDSPLIIDQPEDDLETRLISSLVVSGLRQLKEKQQVIVVTHNPNIPVNGAAEQIVEMRFQVGQIRTGSMGALQRQEIRRAVCEVMEGGKEALDKRYYRISRALS